MKISQEKIVIYQKKIQEVLIAMLQTVLQKKKKKKIKRACVVISNTQT